MIIDVVDTGRVHLISTIVRSSKILSIYWEADGDNPSMVKLESLKVEYNNLRRSILVTCSRSNVSESRKMLLRRYRLDRLTLSVSDQAQEHSVGSILNLSCEVLLLEATPNRLM